MIVNRLGFLPDQVKSASPVELCRACGLGIAGRAHLAFAERHY
jgi:hypothetical protein